MNPVARTAASLLLLLLLAPVASDHGTGGAASLHAQDVRELWLAVRGDSVLVHLGDIPVPHAGFVVYRSIQGGPEERITGEPVRPIADPLAAMAHLGDDLPELMRAIEVDTEFALVRRLQGEVFAGRALSAMSRRAAEVGGRFFVDAELPDADVLLYRIAFVNAAGEETGRSLEGRVERVERIPALAMDLRAESGDARATLEVVHPAHAGDPDDRVVAFHVERAMGEGPFERVTRFGVFRGVGTTTIHLDRDLENERSYRYRVVPLDLFGSEGAASPVAEVVPFDPAPPLPPQRLDPAAGEGVVDLRWTPTPDPRVTGFHVERSTGLDQPFARLTEAPVAATAPRWRDEGVRGGTQYFYRIVAVTGRGLEGRPGTPVGAFPVDVTPPGPPEALAFEVEERRVTLNWSPPGDDDVLGYHVYRGDDPDRMLRLTPEPGSSLRFDDPGFSGSGLNPGATYTFHVTAVDLSFNESEPAILEVLVPDDEPPAPPTGLDLVSVHGRHVDMAWSPGASLDVVAYRVYRGRLDDPSSRPASAVPPVEVPLVEVPHGVPLTHRDTAALVHGATYRYRITAVDRAGNEGDALVGEVRFVDPAPPPAPRHAEARVVPGAGVEVRWERVVHPAQAGFRVYRATLPTGTFQPVSGLLPPDVLAFEDPVGTAGQFYVIRAVTTSGVESGPSPAARAEP